MDASSAIQQASDLITKIYFNLDNRYKISKVFDYNSLEYFAVAIFNTLFDCNLINLNEVSYNSPFIDLIDVEKSLGIQVTKEKPNTSKIAKSINGFNKYGVKRIIVFFFSTSKAKRIEKFENQETWTLSTIGQFLNKNPEKCRNLIKILKIWDNTLELLPSDIIPRVNKNTKDQIYQIVKLKNIEEDLLVRDIDDEERALYFCGPVYGNFVFNSFKSLFFNSQLGKFLVEEDNDETKSFKKLYSNDDYWNVSVNELDERKNKIFESYRECEKNLKKQNYFQFSMRTIRDFTSKMIASNNAVNSNVMSIVRSAGQGKTVFCCELANYLMHFGLPCVFITRILHAGNLYDEFKNQITRLGFNNLYYENLAAILNYAKIWNLPFVIIIDALNEYNNIKESINYIKQIVQDCESLGYYVKIVISSRNKKYIEFKNNLNILSDNIFTVSSHFYNNEEIKNKYFNKYNIKVKHSYFLEKLFTQSRLFIKVFCDIYNSKAKYENFDVIDLFDKYFERKSLIDVEDNLFDDKQEVLDTINLIINNMLSNKKFDMVPLQCFKKEERNNITKLADGDIFNISSNNREEFVGFVFEEYRDYFISLVLMNDSCTELSSFFADKMDMEGLLRDVILLRRKNKQIIKSEDAKFQWYRDGTADIIQNLPLKSLDQVDKEIALEKIQSLSFEETDNLGTINNLISLFLNPIQCNQLFEIDSLINLNETGLKNVKNFISTDYIINDLINSIEKSRCSRKYLSSLISLMVRLNVLVPLNIKSRIKDIVLTVFKVQNLNILLNDVFTSDEIFYLG